MSDTMTFSSLRTSVDSDSSLGKPRSRDVFEAANRHPVTGQQLPGKAGGGKNLINSTLLRKLDQQVPSICNAFRRGRTSLQQTSDHQSQALTDHHKLPEEHRDAWQITKDSRKQGQHQPSGPVPSRNPNHTLVRVNHKPNIQNDLYFLTAQEREVWDALQRTGRVAHYKGVVRSMSKAPLTNVMLVHQDDVEPLQRIQTVSRRMADEDRHKLATTVETLIDRKQRYTLQLLLFEPDLRITSSSIGTGVESPQHIKPSARIKWRRPSSHDILAAGLTGIRDSWIQGRHDEVPNATGKIYAPLPGAARPFTIAEEREGFEDNETVARLHGLRGGGGDDADDHIGLSTLPGGRSAKAFGKLALGCRPARLTDEERVPRALWWLAGGKYRTLDT